ncbi:hypothetical protein [Tropicibacter oceani]|uniref:Uncharacterized protein n=1 Tax=Tropicibacter oceani TaxID=3058420 RepID=A0ABY8QGD7_9RHOB|nr:hypothetical protein [Tropicibacter oceani]WGW03068.1 hypothetical protein QF118_14170 [Tropicibacter oceani]
MILTLILAALAGWAARPAEPRITEILLSALGREGLPDAIDRRVAALLVTLLGAALVLWLLDAPGRPVIFVIGAILGYFQQDIRDRLTNRQG